MSSFLRHARWGWWLAVALAWATSSWAQTTPDYELPPINYSAATPRDAITRLQERLNSGVLVLEREERALLRGLLDALHIPVESQLLVFSKTSLQRNLIHPERPRALYYSDDAYVGWVPGGLIEIVTIDPLLGPVFYAVETRPPHAAIPEIIRDADCLRCHGGTFVRDIPGIFARSVFSTSSGEMLLRHGTLVVDDETPFSDRWGGWYVTGYHGSTPHRGNAFATEEKDKLVFAPDPSRRDTLSDVLDLDRYLESTSDVVALLVFEHQTTMQNAITKAGVSTRKMLTYQRSLQEAFKEKVSDEPTYDSVKSVFSSCVQDVLDRLLFRNAAPLPPGIIGSPIFQETFQKSGLRSTAGDSLRDLDLKERLFSLRCSYLIYSESFRALPNPFRAQLFARLHSVLEGKDPRYHYLTPQERQRVQSLLRETHPDAKQYWPKI
ncbi:MAG TPA: hypothetical protein PLN52_04570 [Opitutaceae bacterium]|nr:hypothetical protein [Opitutaceae bacterium]